jgi:histone H2A
MSASQDETVEAKSSQQPKGRVSHKHTRFFDSYINRILKNVSENEITNNARQQLNSIIIHFTRICSELAINMAEIAKKKTVSVQETRGAVEVTLIGEMKALAISEGMAAIDTYEKDQGGDSGKKTKSRQTRAGIIFPPSVIERFLRKFGYSKIMITNTAPVFLAAVIEYFTAQILEAASDVCLANNKVRITVRDLELGVSGDSEMKEVFSRNKMAFVGGGVVPYIHPFLLKRVPNPNGKNSSTAVKEIKKYQKTGDCLMFARHPFQMIVREICTRIKPGMKISKDVFVYLQCIVEQHLVNTLQLANNLTVYSKRLKVFPTDIEMVLAIQQNRMPKFFDASSSEGMSSSNLQIIMDQLDDDDNTSSQEEDEEVEEEMEEDLEEDDNSVE